MERVKLSVALVVGMSGQARELGEAMLRNLDVHPREAVERLSYLAAIWVAAIALLVIAAIAYGRYQRQS